MRAGRTAAAALLAAAAVLLSALPARADLLQMKDGRVVDGVKMQVEKDAVLVLYRNGILRVPIELVEGYAIEGAPLPEPASDEERAKRAEGLVLFRGKWVPFAVRDKEVRKETEKREKEIAEYRKHKEWRNRYQFKTKTFDFESNLPQGINDDYSEMLETYYKEFAKLWKVQIPREWGRLKICFYASREDFLRTGGSGPYALAYYRFVDPRELNFYYDRNDPALSTACLFHEANHYVTDLLGDGFQYPHWVNEAMAEYYGASTWDSATKTMTMGKVQQYRLADIRSDQAQGKTFGIRQLITGMRDDYEHYTWGWSFVHLLMETPKYRKNFMRFFWDLARAPDVGRRSGYRGFKYLESGEECLRVFLARMGLKEKDLDALEKEWYAHIDAMDATSVEGLEKGGLRAYRDNKWRFKAPRLLKEAIDKGSRKPQVWARYADCLFLRGDDASKAEAVRVIEKACALDPLDADIWAHRGYFTYAAGNKEEGERMLALAQEIDPDGDFYNPEAWLALRAAIGTGE